jgi:hypothetical protein
MIRVCIICEGPTEVEFVNRCLEPYLRPSGVSAYGTVLSARSGRHRGGRVTVDRLAKKISLHYSEADRVSTLVDFYGFQDPRRPHPRPTGGRHCRSCAGHHYGL